MLVIIIFIAYAITTIVVCLKCWKWADKKLIALNMLQADLIQAQNEREQILLEKINTLTEIIITLKKLNESKDTLKNLQEKIAKYYEQLAEDYKSGVLPSMKLSYVEQLENIYDRLVDIRDEQNVIECTEDDCYCDKFDTVLAIISNEIIFDFQNAEIKSRILG